MIGRSWVSGCWFANGHLIRHDSRMTQTMAAATTWPAPAKLNLMLHITGRREDGYHELQTVFQFLDYGDELTFTTEKAGQISRLGGEISVAAEDDLAIKAARALQKDSGCGQGITIKVKKNIPPGAGLGGGSSDAATVLHALNRLWKLDYSTAQLAELGLTLGADVPVFVHGYAAFAEGIGERLTAVELEQPWYLVIIPAVQVSTAKIFQETELTRDSPAIKICDLLQADWQNVCTAVVVRRYPEVAQAFELLGEYAKVRMSGTGAAVFASFEAEAEARAVAAKLQEAGLAQTWTCFVARGRNESPLMRFMSGLE